MWGSAATAGAAASPLAFFSSEVASSCVPGESSCLVLRLRCAIVLRSRGLRACRARAAKSLLGAWRASAVRPRPRFARVSTTRASLSPAECALTRRPFSRTEGPGLQRWPESLLRLLLPPPPGHAFPPPSFCGL